MVTKQPWTKVVVLAVASTSLIASTLAAIAQSCDPKKRDIQGFTIGAPAGGIPSQISGSNKYAYIQCDGTLCSFTGREYMDSNKWLIIFTSRPGDKFVKQVSYRYYSEFPPNEVIAEIDKYYCIKKEHILNPHGSWDDQMNGAETIVFGRTPENITVVLKKYSKAYELLLSDPTHWDADSKWATEKSRQGAPLPKF